MSNESETRIFAFQKYPEWDLPPSEDRDAVERTKRAIREHASDIREAVGKDVELDWVIMLVIFYISSF
jgi:hypothetical protein